MKILHTSDWHVGKLLRGLPRLDEHRAVLGEIADLAVRECVDCVLVTGDLREDRSVLVEAGHAAELLADVPIGGVQDSDGAHGAAHLRIGRSGKRSNGSSASGALVPSVARAPWIAVRSSPSSTS